MSRTAVPAIQPEGLAGGATVTPRFACLDGLRAAAALLIVFHHVGFMSGATYDSWWGPFLSRMDIGVPIFFVLSGFLLYRPFLAATMRGEPLLPPGTFYVRRIVRIFPAYWLALVVQLVLGGIAVGGARGFLTFATLTQIYDETRFLGGINQTWSLATELGFYLFLPLYALGLARLGRGRTINSQGRLALAGIVALIAASYAFRAIAAVADPWWEGISRYWFPALADLFALGMLLALASVWAEHRTLVRRVTDVIGAHPGWWVACALVAFWFVSTQLGLARGLDVASLERETARQFVYGLVGFLLVAAAAFGDPGHGRIRRVLAHPIAAYLGLISYGLYLWHQWAIFKWRDWFGWEIFTGYFWQTMALTLVLSLAIAAVSWHVLESPILQRTRSWGRVRPVRHG